MPVSTEIVATGVLSGLSGLSVPTWQEDLDATDVATWSSTLSTALYDAYERTSTVYGLRLKLDGSWLSEDDIEGDVRFTSRLDTYSREVTFTLTGKAYGIFAGTKSWTRKAVELWQYVGPMEALENRIVFRGVVRRAVQSGIHVPTVTITANDLSATYETYKTCYEAEPFAGRTRGYHIRQLLDLAGITSYSVPDGAVYNKPVSTADENLFAFLDRFNEPEGWEMRWVDGASSSTLEFWEPQIKLSPQASDWVWTYEDWANMGPMAPPAEPKSRLIVRGTKPILTVTGSEDDDAAPLVTKTTITEIDGTYAPAVATLLVTGGTDPTTDPTTSAVSVSSTAVDRTIRRIVDEKTTRSGRPIRQITTEYSWYNPRRAKLVSVSGTPNTWEYLTGSYIDDEGSYRRYPRERFIEVGRRETSYEYDAEGTLTTQTVDVWRHNLRQRPVTSGVGAGYDPDEPNLIGGYVYDDDQSYFSTGGVPYETYELAEQYVTSYEYDADTGKQTKQTTDTYGYYSPRTRADQTGATSTAYAICYDGTGQAATASWRQISADVKTTIHADDGTLAGEIEDHYGYYAPQFGGDPDPANGLYDWGGFTSRWTVEDYVRINSTATQYDIETEDRWKRIVYHPDGSREEELNFGAPPAGRYKASAWTNFANEPFELEHNDDTLEEWFGFDVEATEIPTLQSLDEADEYMRRRRWWDGCRMVTIDRHQSFVAPGDTVELRDLSHSLAHRGLVAQVTRLWNMSEPRFSESVSVAVPLTQEALP